MNARFERRLSRIESRNIGDPFDSLSDDELSALIEAIKENIDADEAVYVSAVAQSLHWNVECAETFLADTAREWRRRI